MQTLRQFCFKTLLSYEPLRFVSVRLITSTENGSVCLSFVGLGHDDR